MFVSKWLGFLLIVFSSQLFAQGAEEFDDIIEDIVPKTQISNIQLKNLRDELKIQKIFIEGVKGIELNGGDFSDIKKATRTIEDLVVSSFGAKTSSLPSHLKTALKKTVRESLNRNAIENTLLTAKNFVYKQAQGRKVMLTSVARRWGFDVGLVYLLTMQIDFTLPAVMMSMGHMEFAPLLATPVSSMATGAYAAIKSGVRMGHLIKSLGGLSSARHHFDIYRKVKNFFHASIFTQYDIIDLDVAGKNFTFTVEKQNLLTRFKQRLGWNKKLNYTNLVNYLESENLMATTVQRVLDSERPEQVKFLRLLHKIEIENNEEVMTSLKSRFGDFIQEMEHMPEFSDGRKWVARISRSQTFEQFNRLMMNIPEEIPPRVFDRVWRNHILPKASKSIGPFIDRSTYQAFRRMERNWPNQMRKAMSESVDLTLDEQWKRRLADYFFESLAPVNGCSAIFTPRGQFAPLL